MAEPLYPPTTWQVLQHVEAALKLITVARGFYTDLGSHDIALEPDQVPESEVLHTVVIGSDLPVTEDTSTRSHTHSTMEILIEVSVPFEVDEGPQQLAHRARADVMRALVPLRKNIKDRPQGVNSFVITGSTVGQPDDGASVVLVQVTARAGLTESISPASP